MTRLFDSFSTILITHHIKGDYIMKKFDETQMHHERFGPRAIEKERGW